MFTFGWIGLAALLILSLGVFAQGDEKSLATSSGKTEPGSGAIQEGVTGCIKNLNGEPVEGVLVQARSQDRSGPPIPEIAILSDNLGNYTWPLFPGDYELKAFGEGYEPATRRITVKPGQMVTLDFSLIRIR
jgi:hypothetical protein